MANLLTVAYLFLAVIYIVGGISVATTAVSTTNAVVGSMFICTGALMSVILHVAKNQATEIYRALVWRDKLHNPLVISLSALTKNTISLKTVTVDAST